VAFVESINSDGSINITEGNYDGSRFHSRTLSTSQMQSVLTPLLSDYYTFFCNTIAGVYFIRR
jgi:hypothetical protein